MVLQDKKIMPPQRECFCDIRLDADSKAGRYVHCGSTPITNGGNRRQRTFIWKYRLVQQKATFINNKQHYRLKRNAAKHYVPQKKKMRI